MLVGVIMAVGQVVVVVVQFVSPFSRLLHVCSTSTSSMLYTVELVTSLLFRQKRGQKADFGHPRVY